MYICVASSVICSVIDFKMVWMAYFKQQVTQLYLEWRISHDDVAEVLAAEGYQVAKHMVWATIYRSTRHMEQFFVYQGVVGLLSSPEKCWMS